MTVTCATPPSTTAAAAVAAASSTTTVPRMGRRKQHCPQKTGISGENVPSTSTGNDDETDTVGDSIVNENGRHRNADGGDADAEDERTMESDSASSSSDGEREVSVPTLDSLESHDNSNGHTFHSKSGMTNQEEALANMLKNHPLLNPTLLSLNPSLYAVQLAQLQAALSQSAGLQHFAAAASSASLATAAAAAAAAAGNGQSRRSAAENQDGRRKRIHDEDEVSSVLNLSKKSPISSPRTRAESPLDLSGSRGSPAKAPKMEDGKFSLPPWAAAAGSYPFLSPFLSQEAMSRFAAAAAAAASGRIPPAAASSPPPSSMSMDKNPLERMSEIAKSGGHVAMRSGGGAGASAGAGPRHSAWQSQWINRGPEATKDIFKCVWCKDSFSTLQALTTHMKETKHFGSSISPSSSSQTRPPLTSQQPPQPMSHVKQPQLTPPPPSVTPGGSKARDILKEQLPMPRKLVRGQDVWLGRGEQQTRDILKCMWCGESFRSLDLMTKHMQDTKHYTKVISQEQLVSWKSTDAQSSPQNHVNAVLTCKVCEQPFSTLKELSDHMVKNNHYKDQVRAVSDGRSPAATAAAVAAAAAAAGMAGMNAASGRPGAGLGLGAGASAASAKEKRKKSLPVRKLLELERAQQELSGHVKSPGEDSAGKISCEKCGDKILMHLFVDHIRQCVGPLPISDHGRLRTPSVSPPRTSTANMATVASTSSSRPSPSSATATSLQDEGKVEEPKSILGSLEKMVQNNFGTKKKPGPESNLSILQRLGIDEGVDYSKPLVDPMAMFRPPSLSSSMGHSLFFHSPSRGNASETRSNSECSSPDRFKQERPASIKSESSSSAKSPPATAAASDSVAKSPISKDFNDGGDDDGNKEEGDSCSDHSKEDVSPISPASSPAHQPRTSTPGSHHTKSPLQQAKSPVLQAEAPKVEKDESEEQEQEDTLPSTSASSSPSFSKGDQQDLKKKKNSHPLAALQMLCDKTEKVPKNLMNSSGGMGGGGGGSLYGASADPGAILAFSWACNQAVINDSLLKCPFCDTPFISKGAYRHHLSKMHFVKDGSSPDAKMFLGGGGSSRTPEKCPTPTSMGGHPGSGGGGGGSGGGGSGETKEENAQSKFAKYSQLAKQLSCSSQP